MRRLPAIAFGALVVATVAAFFITQHLKVSTPLVAGFPRPVPGVISPLDGVVCGGVDHRRMRISFYLLHRSDNVDVYIVDQSGNIVRTVASGVYMRGGSNPVRHYFSWNGRQDDGQLAPDGTYYVRVALIHQGRTVTISGPSGPLPVKVKSEPPTPVVKSVVPHLIPNRASTSVTINYAGNDHRGGTIRLYRTDVPGKPRLVKSFLTPWKGQQAVWNGRIHQRPAPAGTYLVGLDVTDAACNTGHFPATLPPAPGSTPGAGVSVRYLAAEPPLDPVAPGSRAVVYVDARRRPYNWSLERVGASKPVAHGHTSSYTVHVPVPPSGAGLYVLALHSGPHSTAVPLVVHASAPAPALVVLPALTWQGLNPVDDDGDGMPNTLSRGLPIELARPFADGLAPGFGDQAALLAYLDRAHHAYDLTTDLGLIDGVGLRLEGHRLVVLAGTEEWLPHSELSALHAYVAGGGHLLSFGIGSLLRQVTISGGQALDPTPPAPSDPFGATPRPVVINNQALIGVISDDLGIFSTTSGVFSGFSSYQPFAAGGSRPPLRSAAGVTPTAPAIIGYDLRRGIVVDVGLPGFASHLAHDVDARGARRSDLDGAHAVIGYLRRLVRTLAAYQVADVVSKFIAVLLLPVYTRYIHPAGYGVVELLGNGVIFISILVRFGMIEAFLRYHFTDVDRQRRDALARRAVLFTLATTTVASAALAAAAAPLSKLVLGYQDVPTFLIAVLGLWAFTNLELAYGLLRVDERIKAYAAASLINVGLTIAASLVLVVGLGKGARGLLLGNYGASTVVLLGLWWTLRHQLLPRHGVGAERLGTLLRFGLPTVPAEASVYALSIIDRYYIYHSRSPSLAGLYRSR